MNHIIWIQQREDYDTKYHVIKWKTSHFHEPFSDHMVGSAKLKDGAGALAPARETQAQAEGLGLGFADKSLDGRLKFGLGLEDTAAKNVIGAETGRDGVSISTFGGLEKGMETAGAAIQSAALADIHAAENTVTPALHKAFGSRKEELRGAERENTLVAQTGRGNIRNRLKESASRLIEAYRRYREKAAKMSLNRTAQEKTKTDGKKGTRAADRESVLAMQAKNHYLLDSYDQTGNYSMLGKN